MLRQLEPVFHGAEAERAYNSPPPLDSTPRRPALKTKRTGSSDASPFSDEEAGLALSFDFSMRPLRKKSASWSDQLAVVHPVFDTTYRSRSWLQRNSCTVMWAFVSSGFVLVLLTIVGLVCMDSFTV